MYSADGIGRTGHRLLSLSLVGIAAVGLGLVLASTGIPSGFHLFGLSAMTVAFIALGLNGWTAHRPIGEVNFKPTAAKVPTPPLEATEYQSEDTLFDYEAIDTDGSPIDAQPDLAPATDYQGMVPRAAVVDERPPPPPVPEVVRSRHDFAAKYTQDTPQVREILTTGGQSRPQRIRAKHADPSMPTNQLPPATMRGKCGDCDTLLLAPIHRPLELECPECARVTLLE